MKLVKSHFIRFAQTVSCYAGSPYTFMLALAVILIWALTGPMFNYSETWQLMVNTGTTIITFLMIFLVQNTQNRDSKAMQVKLDELIRAMDGAHTVLLDIEKLTDEELDRIREQYEEIAAVARRRLLKGKDDTTIPEVVLDKKIDLKRHVKRDKARACA